MSEQKNTWRAKLLGRSSGSGKKSSQKQSTGSSKSNRSAKTSSQKQRTAGSKSSRSAKTSARKPSVASAKRSTKKKQSVGGSQSSRSAKASTRKQSAAGSRKTGSVSRSNNNTGSRSTTTQKSASSKCMTARGPPSMTMKSSTSTNTQPTSSKSFTTSQLKSTNTPLVISKTQNPALTVRRLLLVREAERTDLIFGERWCKLAWRDGTYCPYNLNMPLKLPMVQNAPVHYSQDPPLTAYGEHEAMRVGQALGRVVAAPAFIYSSPAFSCVTTAQQIIEAADWRKQRVKIRLEPGLLEWLGAGDSFAKDRSWISPESYTTHKFDVDRTYKGFYGKERMLNLTESAEEYYGRVAQVHRHILAELTSMEAVGGEATCIVVSAPCTIDAVVRTFTGAPAPDADKELRRLHLKYPCMSLLSFEQRDDGQRWHVRPSPVAPLSLAGVANRVDHDALLNSRLIPPPR